MFKSFGMRRIAVMAGALAMALCVQATSAQTAWPDRPVTIIVGFTAGGTTDIIARLLGKELSKTWNQPIIVENRPGAGGNIGGAAVAKAKPDGYTLFMGSTGPLAVNSSLYKKMPFNQLEDFAPISLVADGPNILVVNPKAMPVANFAEFIKLVKANPGKYFFGSTGSGTASHLAGELLKTEAGLDVTHVPYTGAGALTDVMGGESLQFMFATAPSVIQLVRSGKLKAIAISSEKRSATLPDLPTVAESGYPGFSASSWFGLVGPKGMSPDVVNKISRDIARILKDKEMHDRFVQQGADPVASTPEQFGAYMRSETAKWAKIVKISHAQVD
jgi:tripartite-type tricarboxylate transporter receptor subunit TctC